MHCAKILFYLTLVHSTLASPHHNHRHKRSNVYNSILHPAYIADITSRNQPIDSCPCMIAEPPKETKGVEPEASSTTTNYMATVDEYRIKLGLSRLTLDAKLETNALKTVTDGNGQMIHELNPGSFGQVLAPGQPQNFHHVFVGGWLCERPDLKGLDGECINASKGWIYSSTSHADIITSGKYKKISCAWFNGIWGCDLGW